MHITQLAYRNVVLSLRRRLFVSTVIALTLAILLVGNTVFEGTEGGLQQTYRDSFTGDISLSSESDAPFTLFGNDLPLVGDYETLPVLANPSVLDTIVSKRPSVLSLAHQVSTVAYLQVGGLQKAAPLFGVNFNEYFGFFPALRLTEGALPQQGQHATLINSVRKVEIEAGLGRPLTLGEPLQLISANVGGFTIREVAYAGAYTYPVGDEMLNRVVLVDADTARALAGYVYGNARQIELSADQTHLLLGSKGLDDLFGSSTDLVEGTGSLSLQSIETTLKTSTDSPVVTIDGAWNFLLIRLKPGFNPDWETGTMKTALSAQGSNLQIRDWRGTAGGNAQLVFFVRVLFNVGMILVVVIAIFVMTNALALGVHERTCEIGTLRALGATRAFVAQLLTLETLIVMTGAGLLGLTLGVATLLVLSSVGIPLSNPLVAALFGSSVLHPPVLWHSVGFHFVLVLAMGAVALILPLRVALGVPPVTAMAQES